MSTLYEGVESKHSSSHLILLEMCIQLYGRLSSSSIRSWRGDQHH
jgi:hypothetical protein